MTSLAISALLGYLLGCSSMAFYLSKLKKVDLRSTGSGNLGASNAMTTLGWGAGILTGLHDMGKAVLAMWLAGYLFPEAPLAPCLAGVSAVLGHMYPFYLRFRGGKGFAAYLGMLLMLDRHFALILMGAAVVLTLATDYIVTATVTTVLCTPLYMLWRGEKTTALLLSAVALPMIWKHRENFRRIREGTEIGFRKANRGEARKKGGED